MAVHVEPEARDERHRHARGPRVPRVAEPDRHRPVVAGERTTVFDGAVGDAAQPERDGRERPGGADRRLCARCRSPRRSRRRVVGELTATLHERVREGAERDGADPDNRRRENGRERYSVCPSNGFSVWK